VRFLPPGQSGRETSGRLNMWNESLSVIRQELGPQEELLWSGQPRQGLALRTSDTLMIPFSLLWGGFAVFWEVMVINSGGPLFMKLWGVPFVLVGLYVIVGRFFVDARQRGKTTYAVTSERVIIISNSFGRKVKSLNLRTLSDVTLNQKSDGSGTITFGAADGSSWWNAGGWQGRRGRPAPPSFDMIQDATKVYNIIREAQRRLG
jgi:hypothetical protein